MNTLSAGKLFWGVVLFFLFALAWLHCADRIDLVTADLGRHLMNGRLFFTEGRILTSNFYSYTYPDFPALCHHWGVGPLLYAAWKSWGFNGLSWAYAGILLGTFGLAVFTAQRVSFMAAAVIAGAAAMPLIGYRIEIRPEGLSTLFLMVEYFILVQCQAGRLRRRWLWLLPFIQLAWVNVHILFFTGLVLAFFFVIGQKLYAGTAGRRLSLAAVLGASCLASLMNPFILRGLSQPFTIFQGYGYDVAENQTVFFMMKRFPEAPVFVLFLALFAAGVVLSALRMMRESSWRNSLPQALTLVFFGLMAVKSVRAIAMFGFLFIPIACQAAGALVAKGSAGQRRLAYLAAGTVVLALLVPYFIVSPLRKYVAARDQFKYPSLFFHVLRSPSLWSGLAPGVEASSDFIKAIGLKGPVFNNFDIGGYFIFTLFPGERPFVDNRPEAYPVDFFKQVYGPMQESDKVWNEKKEQYGFELIYFYRHDMTPWAQPFLIRRLTDPEWAPVFVDNYALILARRGGVNQAVIDRHALLRSIFKAVPH